MYPYAGHLAMGLAGIAIFPESAPAQLGWLGGSLLPDLPAIGQAVADRLRGKHELVEQSPRFLKAQEIINSLPLWGILVLVFYLFSLEIPLVVCLAYLAHLIVDVFTHCGKEYVATDPIYLWPLSQPRLGKVLGVWEYRNGIGLKMPKVPELILSTTVIVTTLCFR